MKKTSHVTEIPEYSCVVYMPSLPSYEFDYGHLDQDGIATLMLYCGQSVRMDYNSDESGSAIEDVPYALRHYFGWDAGVRVLKRKNFTDENWNNMVKDEISQGHPLLYSAIGDHGGHAFVVDGFSSDLFHVNWGWDGYLDGYYSFQPFASEHKSDFIDMQSMVMTPSSIEFNGGFPKNVVIEEATGTWCGYCPRGIVMCDYIRENYSDRIYPIAVHQGDKMEIKEYSQFLTDFVSSYPTAIVNREEAMDISTSGADLLYDEIKDQLTYARINLTSQLVGNKLLINAETEFAADIESEHRLVFVVVEDGVGPYLQANYFTGNSELGLGMWETAGNNVLCHFDDVARHISAYNGIIGSLPNTIKAGEIYQYSTTMDVTNVSSPSCKVIAMILDCQYGSIINADQIAVEASEGFYINKGDLDMAIGDTEKLIAFLNGSPLDEYSAVWKSSDESVVIVDSNGLVEAVGPGKAVITVACDAGVAQCQVNVEIVGSIFEIEGIRYKITGDNTCMVAFPKEGERYMMERVVIPAEIEVLGRSFEVTELEFSMQSFTGAFYKSPNLEEIELPNTISHLPGDVFEYCEKLKKFKSPSSVKFIDAYAFMGCSSLSDLELNEGLTGLWTSCCSWCQNLKNIVLPSTLESMGREVFYGTNPYWIHSKALVPPVLQGDLFHDEMVAMDYEDCALVVPENSLEAYRNAEYWQRFEMIFPDDVILSRYKLKMNPGDEFMMEVVNSEGASVTWMSSDPAIVSIDSDGKITANSFGETIVTAECKGKSASCKIIVSYEGQITESDGLWYEIKENNTCAVIRNQSSDQPYEMEKVTIPSEIEVSGQKIEATEISHSAFLFCTLLNKIEFPNSIKNVESCAFQGCLSLSELIFNEGLESMGSYALSDCSNLESIVLPSTIKTMETEVFSGVSPSRIVCKASTPPSLENDLFDVSAISTAYSECALIVPANSITAYKEAEYWNRFENIVSDGVILNRYRVKLNPGAEYKLMVLNNDGLPVVWSSDNPEVVAVNSEGKLIALSIGLATIKAECNGDSAECLITVSMERMCDLVDGVWYTIIDQNSCEVSAPQGEEYLDLESINLPSSVKLFGKEYELTSIGDDAFQNCNRLKMISIPNSVICIGNNSFSRCPELKDVKLPSYLLSIGNSSFFACPELTNIDLPKSLTSIGNYAFSCTGLTEVFIPDGITEINDFCFWNCSNIKKIRLPESLEIIGFSAFGDCSALEEIIIPSCVRFMSFGCFGGTGLKRIQMLCHNVPEVMGEVFEDGSMSYETCELIVLNEMIDLYRDHPVFSKFSNLRSIGISLDKTVLILKEGDKASLKATVTLLDDTDKSVSWSSSDDSVVTVSENGEVSAISHGNAVITATASNGMSATCVVTVMAKEIEMESIILDAEELALEIGDNHQFVATVLPTETTDPDLEWWIDDVTVATVDQNGFVTMVGEGMTTVHVRSVRWNHIEATCRINVTNAVERIIAKDASCDIYTSGGQLLKKGVSASEIQNLDRGIYIIHQRGKTIKLVK